MVPILSLFALGDGDAHRVALFDDPLSIVVYASGPSRITMQLPVLFWLVGPSVFWELPSLWQRSRTTRPANPIACHDLYRPIRKLGQSDRSICAYRCLDYRYHFRCNVRSETRYSWIPISTAKRSTKGTECDHFYRLGYLGFPTCVCRSLTLVVRIRKKFLTVFLGDLPCLAFWESEAPLCSRCNDREQNERLVSTLPPATIGYGLWCEGQQCHGARAVLVIAVVVVFVFVFRVCHCVE